MSPLDSHTALAAGGLAALLGASAYYHHQAGYRPPLPLQEPAMQLLDHVRRRLVPSATPPTHHFWIRHIGVLARQDLQASSGDLDQVAAFLARQPYPKGHAALAVQQHADEGRVTTMWAAAVREDDEGALRIPTQVWADRVRVVPKAELVSTTATVGRYRLITELVLTDGARAATAEEVTRLLAAEYERLDPAQREHAMVQVAVRPHPQGWAVQVHVVAWSDEHRRARWIRDRVARAVSDSWSGALGRWELHLTKDKAQAQACVQRLLWAPSKETVLPIAALSAWLLPPPGSTPHVVGAVALEPPPPVEPHDEGSADEPSKPEREDPPTASDDLPEAPPSPGRPEVAAPPPLLPPYTGQTDVVPLGELRSGSGEIYGAPVGDLLFAVTLGQAGYGKTTSAVGRFLHMVTRTDWRGQPWGGLFLDPHEDAIHLIKGYLVHLGVPADRIVEVVLGAERVLGWNVLAIDSPREIPDRAGAVVGAFSAAFGWSSKSASHLQGAIDAAARVLLEVALAVREAGRPQLTPTIFQIATLLNDPEWRAYALAFCEDDYYARPLDIPNTSSITTPISRLRGRPEIVALLGNPQGGYDIRAAMDDGQIVLIAPSVPGADRDLQQLISNLFTRDLIRAALSRRDIRNPANRRPFWVCADEAHTVDAAGGPNAAGAIDTIVSEARKFAIRGEFLTQFPGKLRDDTWRALGTNAAQVITTALDPNEADVVARRWSRIGAATIARLGRHEFIGQVQIDGRKSRPFRFHSIEPPYGPPAGDEQVAELDDELDQLLGRRPVEDVVGELTGRGGHRSLDQRLFAWMRRHAPADRLPDPSVGGEVDPDEVATFRRPGPHPYLAERS